MPGHINASDGISQFINHNSLGKEIGTDNNNNHHN